MMADSPEPLPRSASQSDQATGRARAQRRWAGLLLILSAFILYAVTLDNGFQPHELRGGDLITHQYAQVQARPSNAPGYPLYTMGGWLWFHSLRPLAAAFSPTAPNPIPLLSSYSTIWALLALWLLYAIICRVTVSPRHPAGNWPLAWLMGAFYAVTYFFWYYATTTEQYSSAIAQVLAIVYVYLLWRDEVEATSDDSGAHGASAASAPRVTRASSLLLLLAFLCGLSLAHMLTVALIVPPLVLVILWQAPYLLRKPRLIFGSIIAAALPLLGYLYIYVRGAAHPEWWGRGDWPTPAAWFWAFVSTSQGREELGWGFASDATFFANGFPELMWQELSIPFFVLGIAGILLLDRKLATLLYGFSALTLLFAWAYRYGNWYQVILPVYPLVLIGVAALFDRLEQILVTRTQTAASPWPRLGPALPLLLLAAAFVWRAAASLPAADSRNRTGDTGLDRAAVLLDQPLPTGARLFAAVDDALALQYLTDIWALGADAEIVSSRTAGRRLAAGAPVLATWEAAPTLLNELPEEVRMAQPLTQQPLNPDWIVFAPADALAAAAVAQANATRGEAMLPIVATQDIALVDYFTVPSPRGVPVTEAASGLDLTLIWEVDGNNWPDGLNISVRPTRDGDMLADPAVPDGLLQQDRSRPANGLSNPILADQGVRFTDPYRFADAAGADGVVVLLYRAVDGDFEDLAEVYLPLQ